MKRFAFTIILLIFQLPWIAFGMNGTIKGVITDIETGHPLYNANVIVEGTTIGTTSNVEGIFKIENVPPGIYVFKVGYMGYKPYQKKITVLVNETTLLKVELVPSIIIGKSVTIEAKADPNKAIERETPLAFTKLSREELATNYTTGDLPDLIEEVPGVWTYSAGLGESEILIRGFTSDKVGFYINGVPMNEPENNRVHWSNWACLSNIAHSIEVHRGSGFSLNGTGAFGGSVFIETMGVATKPGSMLRLSVGRFNRLGIITGPAKGFVIDPESGRGIKNVNSPLNYTYSMRLNSGPILNDKLNLSCFLEYKTGDSYIQGTNYDGYSLGIEALSKLGNHTLQLSFFTAPQDHNQAFALQDFDLLKTLGREYNRKNHVWQENYYCKPFYLLRHEWQINERFSLTSKGFYSNGVGADQSAVNDVFDTKTGLVDYQPINILRDAISFKFHANYLRHVYGVETTGYNEIYEFWNLAYDYSGRANFFTEDTTHSWQRRGRRDHDHIGFSSNILFNDGNKLKTVLGFDIRGWKGRRNRESWNLRWRSRVVEGSSVWLWDSPNASAYKIQSIYDYDTRINNFTLFGKMTYKPFSQVTIEGGGQLYSSDMKVIENPIQFFDFGTMNLYPDVYLRTTADKIDSTTGELKFIESDYHRSYNFFAPWGGINYNISKELNCFANYAIAKKEPKILDWYDYDDGPIARKIDGKSLNPETAKTYEIGLGYRRLQYELKANFYNTTYLDKIETVTDINDRVTSINAGKAVYKGVELEFRARTARFNFSGNATISKNRWKKMNVKEIFDEKVEDIMGKVVPFSPERMASASLGYLFRVEEDHFYRVGLNLNYWDEYYGTYTNEYTKPDGSVAKSKLPCFLDLGLLVTFTKTTQKADYILRVELNNILNRKENYYGAQYSIDYTRNDALAGKYHWYVLQAPVFHLFVTTEIAIH